MTRFAILQLFISYALYVCINAEKGRYTNEWVVEVREGSDTADEIAQRHGFRNLGKV